MILEFLQRWSGEDPCPVSIVKTSFILYHGILFSLKHKRWKKKENQLLTFADDISAPNLLPTTRVLYYFQKLGEKEGDGFSCGDEFSCTRRDAIVAMSR